VILKNCPVEKIKIVDFKNLKARGAQITALSGLV
jgi:hypothetical protein